jgi:hypothetical protein
LVWSARVPVEPGAKRLDPELVHHVLVILIGCERNRSAGSLRLKRGRGESDCENSYESWKFEAGMHSNAPGCYACSVFLGGSPIPEECETFFEVALS